MKSSIVTSVIATAVVTTATLLGAVPSARPLSAATPEGFTHTDWSGIRAVHERQRHAITANQDGTTVTFHDPAGEAALTYGGLKAWDADGKPVPARFATGTAAGSDLCVVVNDAAARYPVTIDPLASQAYLKASNTGCCHQGQARGLCARRGSPPY
jgi:hypothetical protein